MEGKYTIWCSTKGFVVVFLHHMVYRIYGLVANKGVTGGRFYTPRNPLETRGLAGLSHAYCRTARVLHYIWEGLKCSFHSVRRIRWHPWDEGALTNPFNGT